MKQNTNSLNILAVFFLLSGCAIVPDLGKAPEPKDVASLESSQSLSSSTKATWPDSSWWRIYGDNQLAGLIEEALIKAPSIAEAEARIRQANAIAGRIESSLYPNISANGSYQNLRQSYHQGTPDGAIPKGFNDVATTELQLSFDLDFWGKNRSALAAATSEAEATRLEGEQTRLIVSTSIASVYADLAQLYANLDSANDALAVRSRTASLIKQRQDNGLENKGSYEQEAAAKASAEAEIEALNESIALTKNRLVALMGAGPDRALEVSRPDIQKIKPFGLPENLPAELLGRRPDVMAARLQAQASSKRIDAAEASFYPNVNLIGYVGHQALGLGYFTSPQSLISSFGPSVTLPILDGGSLRSQYRQARATYDYAVALYDDTLLHALHDVANVVTSEKMLAPRLQKTAAAVKASEEAYAVVNNRYKGGLSSYLEVLRSEDALIASRRALADLRTRSFTLDVALVRALGGGFVTTTVSE